MVRPELPKVADHELYDMPKQSSDKEVAPLIHATDTRQE